MSTPLSFIVIGNGALLIECCEVLLRRRRHEIRAVISDNRRVREWAGEKGIALFTMEDESLPSADWLLSIANLRLIPESVLARAGKGAINFHDGPLPRHAGLNAPVWALIEGEERHGITWHLIDPSGVDRGDILERRDFAIAPEETALTLNTKCFEAGLESFAPLLAAIETGTLAPEAQDFTQRSLHRGADLPPLAGLLDFSRDAGALCRLVRALDHGPYLNPLCAPKILHQGRMTLVGRADEAPPATDAPPGTVLAVEDAALVVATATVPLRLSALCDTDGRGVDPASVALAGEVLLTADLATDMLEKALAAAARAEPHWRDRLSDLRPLTLPLAKAPAGPDAAQVFSRREVDLPEGFDRDLLPVLVALWARGMSDESDADIAFRAKIPARDMARAWLSDWVPLRLPDPRGGLGDFARALGHDLNRARVLGPHARDLIARDPGIAPPACPALGLSEMPGPIPGTCLSVENSADGLFLHIDESRLTGEIADLLAARLDELAKQLAEEGVLERTVDSLRPMPETERRMVLERWNRTDKRLTGEKTIHGQIEARAALDPDAVAVIAGEDRLTYGELDRRAERLAARLRAAGIGTGSFVGLASPRDISLPVALFGILKAGAAYVPLDTAYPADRLRHYINDSGMRAIVTTTECARALPDHETRLILMDSPDTKAEDAPHVQAAGAKGEDLAYLIYTSGSTGIPKGVMVSHANVTAFFAGMDARLGPAQKGDSWLAMTSLSFDISVLELLYTLARGYRLVIAEAGIQALEAPHPGPTPGGMGFGLFFWGNDDGPGRDKYRLLLEGARFADENGFTAVWTPERHFHAFGGPFPNPAVTGAAVAAVTRNLSVRAGSCVAPLHHTARIAEDWAVIDNLTNGRVGLGIASGWQPDDFVLRPENTPPDNKAAMYRAIDDLRALWRGEAVEFPTRDGKGHKVVTQPRPVSKELPIWVTIAGNPDTWREAGEIGANVLTHLLGQSIDEVAGKIEIYHRALREAGHDPADFKVTMMLHTFIGDSREQVRDTVRAPMKAYLQSAAGLIKQCAWAFPAFKKPKGVSTPFEIDLETLSADEMEGILEFAFQRYFDDSGLFGTIEDGLARIEQLRAIGVSEIACLIDYGVPAQTVLQSLKPLAELVRRSSTAKAPESAETGIAALIRRHGITHLQCTPSMARLILADPMQRAALAQPRRILLGGEPLPGALVAELETICNAEILNMYGPTETTIWSSSAAAVAGAATVNIGHPLANTRLRVLDAGQEPVPLGRIGELYIAGAGVAQGYWRRDDLTKERFLPDPFEGTKGARMYRTGDLVRRRADGALEFLGRADQQVKLRGYRLETGEIEACLDALPGVAQSAVLVRSKDEDQELVAFVSGPEVPPLQELRAHLRRTLPDYMIPARFHAIDSLPLTPNGKTDRQALAAMRLSDPAPAPVAAPSAPPGGMPAETPAIVNAQAPVAVKADSPAGAEQLQERIAAIWARVLGVDSVRAGDSFFDLGGHSLLAVQALREMQAALEDPALGITDIFRFPRLGDLAAHLAARGGVATVQAIDPQADTPAPTVVRALSRAEAMARRRALRARRASP